MRLKVPTGMLSAFSIGSMYPIENPVRRNLFSKVLDSRFREKFDEVPDGPEM
jgi:hypothetical protein